MFIANDSNGNRIEITNANKENDYFCPLCSSRLIVKNGDIKKHHFAHKSGRDCDDWSSDMSEWHYNWQNMFPEKYREVVVEYNGKKHRADILLNGIVIEFQHSKMSKQEFAERNRFYTSAGYKVIWLFDLKYYCRTGKFEPFYKHGYYWKWAPRTFDDLAKNHNNILLFFEFEINNEKSIQLFLDYDYAGKHPYVTLFETKLNIKDEKQFYKLLIYFAKNKDEMDRIKNPEVEDIKFN